MVWFACAPVLLVSWPLQRFVLLLLAGYLGSFRRRFCWSLLGCRWSKFCYSSLLNSNSSNDVLETASCLGMAKSGFESGFSLSGSGPGRIFFYTGPRHNPHFSTPGPVRVQPGKSGFPDCGFPTRIDESNLQKKTKFNWQIKWKFKSSSRISAN